MPLTNVFHNGPLVKEFVVYKTTCADFEKPGLWTTGIDVALYSRLRALGMTHIAFVHLEQEEIRGGRLSDIEGHRVTGQGEGVCRAWWHYDRLPVLATFEDLQAFEPEVWRRLCRRWPRLAVAAA